MSEKEVLCIFKYAKIWRIHCVFQSTNMNMMEMLNY